jgi:hypothetical protein
LQSAKASATTLSQQEKNNSAAVQRERVNISGFFCTAAIESTILHWNIHQFAIAQFTSYLFARNLELLRATFTKKRVRRRPPKMPFDRVNSDI